MSTVTELFTDSAEIPFRFWRCEDAIEHVATNMIKPQVLPTCAAAAEAHRAARREMPGTLQAATV